jgi:phosphoserine phosphatase RsbU/P
MGEAAGRSATTDDTEHARLAALRRYAILDTPPDGAFDRVAKLAVRIFHVPIASITIVDQDRVWFKATQGLPQGLYEIPRAPGLCASVVLHGDPQVVTDARNDPDLADHPVITELGVGFYAGAPLTTADGYRLGTINVMDTEPREFSDADLSTLTDLAAVVMDELELRLTAMRAIQLEHELRLRAEAETQRLATLNGALQATLLPPVLSAVPGLEVAAHYHIASPENVGGDFYDLFPLDEGRWAFFLGDVCGKGIAAAALTSLTRYTLRAAAVYNPDPTAVLRNLNTVLAHEYAGEDPRFCTALFGLLTPHPGIGFTLTLAGGGHPPALLLRADGRVASVDLPGGQLIGVLPDPHIATATATLGPGDGVMLYTDGLTEACTGPGSAPMYGEDRLLALAAGLTGQSAPAIIAAVDKILTGFGTGLSDDTAVLALTVPAAQ